jgi:hypothetical protein
MFIVVAISASISAAALGYGGVINLRPTQEVIAHEAGEGLWRYRLIIKPIGMQIHECSRKPQPCK